MSDHAANSKATPSYPEQNADGIDLSLIRQNLCLTPTERVRRAAQHVRSMLKVRANAKRITQK